MAPEPPPRPISAWMQISALIFVFTTIFYAGTTYRRLVVLENWRVQVTARAEIYDTRMRAVEALHASTQADLMAIRSALGRIERAIDAGDPP